MASRFAPLTGQALQNAYSRAARARWRIRLGFYSGSNPRWSEAEDRQLRELKARGLTSGQIALRIKRTPSAVLARLRYLR